MAKLKAKTIEEKLRQSHGNIAAVARAFGVTRQAVYNFINRYEHLKQVLVECREVMKDDVESALYSAALNGEAWAVNMFLARQARDRGYGEQVDHNHNGNIKFDWDVFVKTISVPDTIEARINEGLPERISLIDGHNGTNGCSHNGNS